MVEFESQIPDIRQGVIELPSRQINDFLLKGITKEIYIKTGVGII